MRYDHAVSFNFSITTPLDSDDLTLPQYQRVFIDAALQRLCALITEINSGGSHTPDVFEVYDTVDNFVFPDPNEEA